MVMFMAVMLVKPETVPQHQPKRPTQAVMED
jgi:hypothetical protein